MRTTVFRCEGCGREAQGDLRARPETWWLLEDCGRVQRTGPLDFCSLPCLGEWLRHPEVEQVFAADFAARV